MKNLNILHICYQTGGGAGIAATRLHRGLRQLGIKSKMLLLKKDCADEDIIEYKLPSNESLITHAFKKWKVRNARDEFNIYSHSRPSGLSLFSDARTPYSLEDHPLVREADIIHLHWIARIVDCKKFFRKVAKPIVWTLHDMNPLTGGCHYSGDCRKYENKCGACFQLGSTKESDLSTSIWKCKSSAYKRSNLHCVSPSRWLTDCVKKSSLLGNFPRYTVPYGIPEPTFKYIDKTSARNSLKLSTKKIIILFGADSLLEKRKGFELLIDALKILKAKNDISNIVLAVFGKEFNSLSINPDFDIHNFDYSTDEQRIALYYNAADFLVTPALEDNLPNVILESMACGTPCIGFNVGGIPDMIRHNITGRLAKSQNTESLYEEINWMIDHPQERSLMGIKSQEVIRNEYLSDIQSKRYLNLYESLLDGSDPQIKK